MQEACNKISGYVSGMGLEDFRADPRTVNVIVRNLAINPKPLSVHHSQTLPPLITIGIDVSGVRKGFSRHTSTDAATLAQALWLSPPQARRASAASRSAA
jgi:hypothetical protein